MELRTLRYFVCIAEARSFSNASVHLRVAQPALSRQISKLEAEIGVPLFLRTGRRLELTEAGERLLTRAYALLLQVSNTLDEVRTFGSDLSGTINVGVSPATTEILSPLILRECAAQHPNIKIRFVEGFSGLIFDQLLNQELTLCLLHNPPAHKAVEIHPLLVEEMHLVGPPNNHKGLHPAKRGMQLETLPMILPNRTHSLRRMLEEALHGPHRLKVRVETDGVITTRALVATGLGYTILPYSAVYNQLQAGQLSSVHLTDLNISWTLSLACRSDQRSTRLVQAILGIINSQMDVIKGDRNVSLAASA